MPYSAKSDDSGTINQFTRRKEVIITTGGTSTPADYQVKLTITYESEMRAGFDDIRFNTKANGYIDYWIESYIASTTVTVWVKLPDAITDPIGDTIWIYYGNDAISDGGNIGDTFIVGDDGETGSPIGGWTQDGTATIAIESTIVKSGSYSLKINTGASTQSAIHLVLSNLDSCILEYDMRLPAITASLSGRLHDGAFTNEKGTAFFYKANEDEFQYYDTSYHTVQAVAIDTWYGVKLVAKSTSAYDIYIDDVLKITNANTRNSPANYNRAAIGGYHTNADIYIDNFRVRKYIANEPTSSYGTAQHQRRVPQFIG